MMFGKKKQSLPPFDTSADISERESNQGDEYQDGKSDACYQAFFLYAVGGSSVHNNTLSEFP